MNNKELLKRLGFREDYDEKNRIIKQEYINFNGMEYYISTVDLGINYGLGDFPLYYETMIFPTDKLSNNWRDMYCNRYRDRETALQRHKQLIEDINMGKYEIIDGHFYLKD
jgi:hypothetical protein